MTPTSPGRDRTSSSACLGPTVEPGDGDDPLPTGPLRHSRLPLWQGSGTGHGPGLLSGGAADPGTGLAGLDIVTCTLVGARLVDLCAYSWQIPSAHTEPRVEPVPTGSCRATGRDRRHPVQASPGPLQCKLVDVTGYPLLPRSSCVRPTPLHPCYIMGHGRLGTSSDPDPQIMPNPGQIAGSDGALRGTTEQKTFALAALWCRCVDRLSEIQAI